MTAVEYIHVNRTRIVVVHRLVVHLAALLKFKPRKKQQTL